MEHNLKQLLQEKMNGGLGDEGGFDKSAAWQALQDRLQQRPPKRKVVFLPRPLRYAAAAVLAGLLLTLSLWLRRDGSPALAVNDDPRVVAPSSGPVEMPLSPAVRPVAPPAKPAGMRAASLPRTRKEAAAVLADGQLPASDSDSTALAARTTVPEPVPALLPAAATPRRRAAHLLDISTDDRDALLPGLPPAGGLRISTLLGAGGPVPAHDDVPPSILRGLARPAQP